MRLCFASFVAVALAACGPDRPMVLAPTDSAVMDSGQDSSLPPPADGGRCMRQEDCNDNIACTEETCIVGGVCERTANDRMCPMGQRCFFGRGCASGTSCMRNEDCDDRVACTRDVCGAGGTCQHIRDDSRCSAGDRCSFTLNCVAPGRCGTDPDCDDGRFCNGTERCTGGMCAPGTAPNCADMDMCTADVCNEMTRMCDHVMVNPCGGSVTPGMYDLAEPFQYTCGAGNVGPVSSITLEVTGGTAVVRGFPVELRGTAGAGTFNTMGTWFQGGCSWVFTLTGAFTMPNRFTGSLGLNFDSCPISLRCIGASPSVTGTRR